MTVNMETANNAREAFTCCSVEAKELSTVSTSYLAVVSTVNICRKRLSVPTLLKRFSIRP